MNTINSNPPQIIAYCGLYCTNCGKFKNGKCPGCQGNEKASWCRIRTCCKEKDIANCSGCDEFANSMDCKEFNSIISRMFGYVFNSNRTRCIEHIKTKGTEDFVCFMEEKGWMSFPRKYNGQKS
jgi:hypothetical protein